MAKGEISPRFVGKVDQDLAAARANLVQHIADMRAMLANGESTEVVFMHFAQTMLRETNAFHLSIMFAAATLTLTQREEAPKTRSNWPADDVLRSADGRGGHASLEIEVNGARYVLAAFNARSHIWHISPINQQAFDTGLLAITAETLHDPGITRKHPRR